MQVRELRDTEDRAANHSPNRRQLGTFSSSDSSLVASFFGEFCIANKKMVIFLYSADRVEGGMYRSCYNSSYILNE